MCRRRTTFASARSRAGTRIRTSRRGRDSSFTGGNGGGDGGIGVGSRGVGDRGPERGERDASSANAESLSPEPEASKSLSTVLTLRRGSDDERLEAVSDGDALSDSLPFDEPVLSSSKDGGEAGESGAASPTCRRLGHGSSSSSFGRKTVGGAGGAFGAAAALAFAAA